MAVVALAVVTFWPWLRYGRGNIKAFVFGP